MNLELVVEVIEMGNRDVIVMVGIIVLGVLWMLFGLRKWLHAPVKSSFYSVPINREIKDSVAVQLLRRDGYQVIGGKFRIPFSFEVNNIQLDSRLFVDYVAKHKQSYYLVKVARERSPMEWTASHVRNKLLPYFLLYSDVDGMLYVDELEQEVHQIHFQLEEE